MAEASTMIDNLPHADNNAENNDDGNEMIFVTLSEAEETTELPKHQIDHDTSPIDFNDAEILSGDGEEKVVDHKKAATHINDYLNGAEDTNMAGLLGDVNLVLYPTNFVLNL